MTTLRARLALATTAALLGAAVVAFPAGARAPAPAPAKVAADPVTITGRGYGHGVGMSQQGARGGADLGRSAQQILSTYYPGAQLSPAPTRSIRVVLQRHAAQSCQATPQTADPCLWVRAEPGQRFVNLASGGQVPAPTQVGGQPVTGLAAAPGPVGLRLWARTGTSTPSWHVLENGAQFTGPIDIVSTDGIQNAVYPAAERAYRGSLRFVKSGATTITPINVLPLNQYLLGVVPDEMPASWPTAAVQAQAVAAATYAAADMRRNQANTWDTCDTTACQVYGGVTAEHPSATSKIQNSPLAGQVLTAGGVPITAFFSASNGGYSLPGGASYLPARADSWDPATTWTRTVDGSCMATRYPGNGSFLGVEVTGRDGRGAHGGRVTSMRLHFSGGAVTVSPSGTPMAIDNQIRTAFTGCVETGLLRSSMFQVSAVAPPPPPPPTGPGYLLPGRALTNGQALSSPSGQHALTVGTGGMLWRHTSRSCAPAGGVPGTGTVQLVMQNDGNLVAYVSGTARWHTGTHANPGAFASMQNDANLVVYSADRRPLWQSGNICSQLRAHESDAAYGPAPRPARLQPGDSMQSPDRRSTLVMQGDGNLVLTRDGQVRWHSGTYANPGARVIFQQDGNLVLYAAAGPALWHTRTARGPDGAHLLDHSRLVVAPEGLRLLRRTQDTRVPGEAGFGPETVIWQA